ncbi:hypothetical protein FRC07_010112, partial [Ceratobasidium sp. 392]
MSYSNGPDIEVVDNKTPTAGNRHIDHVSNIDEVRGEEPVVKVRNPAYTAAIAQSTLNAWSRDSFLLYCSLMTAINIMPYYQAKFGVGTLGSTTGIIFSMYTIGNIAGAWFAGPITDHAGRRVGMLVGATIICVGTAVIASSNLIGQFIAGRFILGFGVCILATAACAYSIEIAPPQWRGRMTGFYACGWFSGAIPAAGITLGTSAIQSDMSWRLPLIFPAAPCLLVICTIWSVPESPRWLMANFCEEAARAFLVRFHGGGDPSSALVELEWREFKEDIAIDGADKRWWDYSGLFATPSARWRSLMVLLMAVFGQFSGNGLAYFNTEIYNAVGYSNYMQFVLNLVSNLVAAFAAGCGVALADLIPRREMLVIGTALSAITLAINGALSAKWAQYPADHKNLHVGRGAVAAYFWFCIVNSFAYTVLQAVYPAECLQTNTRAKGLAMYSFVINAVSFINLYAGPIALQNM